MTQKRERTQSTKKLLGAANSESRTALIDAAETLIREEGYAAVSSRRIAAAAGQKHQVIYYYFDTLEDLYLAVFRRASEAGFVKMKAALESNDPLRALWTFSSDPGDTRFVMEFMALANHNELIRAEIGQHATRTRLLQAEAITLHLAARGIGPGISPVLIAVLMQALARLLVNEGNLGLTIGHDEARTLVETCLRHFEETGAAPPAARPLFEDD